MGRVVVMTLAYNRADFVGRALERLDPGCEAYVIGLGYPFPSKDQNTADLVRVAEKYGATFIQTHNVSVSRNWTWVCNTLGLQRGDILIGLDPDSRPFESGWVQAMVDVYRADHTVSMVTMNGRAMRDAHHLTVPFRLEEIGGRRCRVYDQLVQWSLMSFAVDFIHDAGGLREDNDVYGFSEHWAYREMPRLGRRWVMLEDFHDECVESPDDLYMTWKELSRQKRINQTLEEWIATRGSR